VRVVVVVVRAHRNAFTTEVNGKRWDVHESICDDRLRLVIARRVNVSMFWRVTVNKSFTFLDVPTPQSYLHHYWRLIRFTALLYKVHRRTPCQRSHVVITEPRAPGFSWSLTEIAWASLR
jgi:hypothetical protein